MTEKQGFALLFITGVIIGFTPLTDRIHEEGHLRSFEADGIPARITSNTSTSTAELTLQGLTAGYSAEFFFWYTWLIVAYAFSKPRSMGIRRHWAITGLPLGTCHYVAISALGSSDFNRMAAESIKGTWIFVTMLFLSVAWLILYVTRIKK